MFGPEKIIHQVPCTAISHVSIAFFLIGFVCLFVRVDLGESGEFREGRLLFSLLWCPRVLSESSLALA